MSLGDAGHWAVAPTDRRRTYFEVWRRHKLIGTAPVVLALLISVLYMQRSGPSYTAAATMWIDSPVPNASTILEPAVSGPPSATAESVLQEVLSSQGFLTKVVSQTPEAAEMKGLSAAASAKKLGQIAAGISIATPGPQLLSITAKESSPALAVSVAREVASQFSRFVASNLIERYQAAAIYDKDALGNATRALTTAITQLTQYNQQHPGAARDSADATEAQLTHNVAVLQSAENSAQQALAAAHQQANINLSTALNSTQISGVPKVFDLPRIALKVGHKKRLALGAIGGLLAGIVISAAALAFLMARDKSVRTEEDVEDVLSLQVLGSVDDASQRRWVIRKSS